MDRNTITGKLSEKVKLVRVENNYTQERMASILGISKKTLIQIEKGRLDANWTTIVAMCALFQDSEIINHTVGKEALEIVKEIAHQ